MKIEFLGTGSGEAIPRKNCNCQQCASKDRKDQRLRPVLLIDRRILIDAGPDIARQLDNELISKLEAVLITHNHSDHTGGLKDLLKVNRDIRIIRLQPGQHFKLLGIDFYAFKVRHSKIITTVGLEINSIVYVPDFLDLDLVMKYLKESKLVILDGSVFGRSLGGHMAMNEIIAQTKNLKNLEKIYFTHNGHTRKNFSQMQKLIQSLGDSRYNLAYDGLEIEVI